MDERELAILRQEITGAIEDGMKAGAAHIAEALARPPQGLTIPWANGVTLEEMVTAVTILVASNTRMVGDHMYLGHTGRTPMVNQIEAWKTLRRALDMPT